jgi:hypothetical protein
VIFMAVAPRRSSMWTSAGAGGDVVCAMDTGTNRGTLAAVLTGKEGGLGGDTAAPSRWRASLRQPCTMFAFTPCDIATFATDAPGAAHCSNTNALNCALCRRRSTTLSAAIVSTYSLMDTIIGVTPPPFKVPRLDAYVLTATGAMVLAMFCAAMAAIPRMLGPVKSMIFFARIKEQSCADYVAQFAQLNEQDLLSDLTVQIHRNAEIASEKHWWVRKSLIWSFLGAIPWVAAIALLVKL